MRLRTPRHLHTMDGFETFLSKVHVIRKTDMHDYRRQTPLEKADATPNFMTTSDDESLEDKKPPRD